MAPNRPPEKDLTVAADVYSLGVILYDRLTGRTPFDGQTPFALLRQVRESEPPRPSTIRPGLDQTSKPSSSSASIRSGPAAISPPRRWLMTWNPGSPASRSRQGRPPPGSEA